MVIGLNRANIVVLASLGTFAPQPINRPFHGRREMCHSLLAAADIRHPVRHDRDERDIRIPAEDSPCTLRRERHYPRAFSAQPHRSRKVGDCRRRIVPSCRSPRFRCRFGRTICRNSVHQAKLTLLDRLVRALWRCRAPSFGLGTWADTEPLLMMRPPRGS